MSVVLVVGSLDIRAVGPPHRATTRMCLKILASFAAKVSADETAQRLKTIHVRGDQPEK